MYQQDLERCTVSGLFVENRFLIEEPGIRCSCVSCAMYRWKFKTTQVDREAAINHLDVYSDSGSHTAALVFRGLISMT